MLISAGAEALVRAIPLPLIGRCSQGHVHVLVLS